MAFMKHTKWDQALFCHWRIDATALQPLLPDKLIADTTADGSAWIGLVLLEEQGVGPGGVLHSMLHYLTVDHLGANIRTYVRGPNGPGIYFFSLECDSLLATLGANVFGIPYKVASMSRQIQTLDADPTSASSPQSEESLEKRKAVYKFYSTRAKGICPHGKGISPPAAPPSVDCVWRRGEDLLSLDTDDWRKLTQFFVERYRVYTKQGVLFCGVVNHDPWPVEHVKIESLQTDLIRAALGFDVKDCAKPDHVVFSPGVGPVHFNFLKPC